MKEVSVVDFDAVGNGRTDDANAIQDAVNAVSSTGGIVRFPPGIYALSKTILVLNSRDVQLIGSGELTVLMPLSNANISLVSFDHVKGGAICNLSFNYSYDIPFRPSDFKPTEYPYSIDLVAITDLQIRNINLRNSFRGIHVDGGGRLHIDNIFGQPLREGIGIKRADDVVKVSNVHFGNGCLKYIDQQSVEYLSYRHFQYRYGISIRSWRNDNPHFYNIFCIGYRSGFVFTRPENEPGDHSPDSGPTSKFMIQNADCDTCHCALEIKGKDTTGMISNFNAQAPRIESEESDTIPDSPKETTGIWITGDGAILQASNVRLVDYERPYHFRQGVSFQGHNLMPHY